MRATTPPVSDVIDLAFLMTFIFFFFLFLYFFFNFLFFFLGRYNILRLCECAINVRIHLNTTPPCCQKFILPYHCRYWLCCYYVFINKPLSLLICLSLVFFLLYFTLLLILFFKNRIDEMKSTYFDSCI